jgi:hypothetical protein
VIAERLTWRPDASSSLECVIVSLFCVNLLDDGGGTAKSPSAGRGSGAGGVGDLGLNARCRGGRVILRGTERRLDRAGIARNEALIRDCR